MSVLLEGVYVKVYNYAESLLEKFKYTACSHVYLI